MGPAVENVAFAFKSSTTIPKSPAPVQWRLGVVGELFDDRQ